MGSPRSMNADCRSLGQRALRTHTLATTTASLRLYYRRYPTQLFRCFLTLAQTT